MIVEAALDVEILLVWQAAHFRLGTKGQITSLLTFVPRLCFIFGRFSDDGGFWQRHAKRSPSTRGLLYPGLPLAA